MECPNYLPCFSALLLPVARRQKGPDAKEVEKLAGRRDGAKQKIEIQSGNISGTPMANVITFRPVLKFY